MITELLKKNNIDIVEYKKMNKVEIVRINTGWNIVTIYGNDNTFTIRRNVFEYINKHDAKYAFCLINKEENKIYYLEFKNKNNWLQSSFDSCKKDELYFGKIVLQNRINVDTLTKKILEYK